MSCVISIAAVFIRTEGYDERKACLYPRSGVFAAPVARNTGRDNDNAYELSHCHLTTAWFQYCGCREATATLALDADPALHGNQQGTVHGGLLCELADAAIGTAHSTLMKKDESFTSIDIKTTFLRPVWRSRLLATARVEHRGKMISHYRCEIAREDGKVVAIITSTVLTLTGEKARGR
jgi:uncharacterized protein (TIGR00369 family)